MIVDWLSFTVPTEPIDPKNGKWEYGVERVGKLLRTSYPALYQAMINVDEFLPCAARAPYTACWKSKSGVTFFYSPNLDNTLFEFSGKGCEWLRQNGLESDIIKSTKDRMTRLDLALDLPDITPDEIHAKGYSKRFRAHSRIDSQQGTTHYIGSVKSERYARVYRYNKPHPRSHLCRIEVVHRKRYAKILANEICDTTIDEAGKRALASYDFQHPAIERGLSLPTVQIDKNSSNTIRWLIAQAAPAFQKLVAEGAIENPEAFLTEYFMPS